MKRAAVFHARHWARSCKVKAETYVIGMVKTRGGAAKASSIDIKPVKAEARERKSSLEPPKKRQKRIQTIKGEAHIKSETSEPTNGSAALPEEARAAKDGKKVKKLKKLLQTAHTAQDLPAIQHKASKVKIDLDTAVISRLLHKITIYGILCR